MSNFVDALGGTVTPHGDPGVSTAICKYVQSARFIGLSAEDNETLPGSAQYLELEAKALPGNFIIDFWVYLTELPDTGLSIPLLQWGDSLDGADGLLVLCEPDNSGSLSVVADGEKTTVTGITINTWTYVAVSRLYGNVSVGIGGGSWATRVQMTPDSTARPFIVGAGVVSNPDPSYIYMEDFMIGNLVLSNQGLVMTRPLADRVYFNNNHHTVLSYVPMSQGPYAFTSLLLPLTGANNGTVFTDTSAYHKTVTRSGSTVTVTGTGKFNNSSTYFNGSNCRLDTTVDLSGTADIYISGWFYLVNGGHGSRWARIFHLGSDNNTGALNVVCTDLQNPTNIFGSVWTPGEISFGSTSAPLSNNTWHHLAIVRKANLWYLIVNGVNLSGGGSLISTDLSQTDLHFGSGIARGEWFNGYLQDFRFVKGVTVDPNSITVPTAPSDPFVPATWEEVSLARPGVTYTDVDGHAVLISGYKPRYGRGNRIYPPTPSTREGPYEIAGTLETPGGTDPADVKMVLIRFAHGDNEPVVIRTTTGAGGTYSFSNLRSDQTYYPIALPPSYLPPGIHGPYPSE